MGKSNHFYQHWILPVYSCLDWTGDGRAIVSLVGCEVKAQLSPGTQPKFCDADDNLKQHEPHDLFAGATV